MNKDKVLAYLAMAEKATEGPWNGGVAPSGDMGYVETQINGERVSLCFLYPRYEGGSAAVYQQPIGDNAAFIAVSRTLGPDLAREVLALRKLATDLADLLGDFAGAYIREGEVVETRGSLGRRLANVWPRAYAFLKGKEESDA